MGVVFYHIAGVNTVNTNCNLSEHRNKFGLGVELGSPTKFKGGMGDGPPCQP